MLCNLQSVADGHLDTVDRQCQTRVVADWLGGTWKLTAWRRIADDGAVSYPLGTDAHGQLVYTSSGEMAVQIMGANRSALDTDDPLGGNVEARASAYSTYLAYFGTYELQGDSVVHRIDGSLFPNWCGEKQVRPFTSERGELVLRTPPMKLANGTTVVNELAWARDER